jgi:hypothetical protein
MQSPKAMPDQSISHILELPPPLLALLFKHTARGPGGLASAAAFSQTCTLLHSLSEGYAVIYSDLMLATVISSPDHPIWKWLAKRSACIAGLSLELRIEWRDDAKQDADDLPDWMQPLQTLSSIPGVQLKVTWVNKIADLDHPCIAQWLKQLGQSIKHLTAKVYVSDERLSLREFSEAAASCSSIDLAISHSCDEVVDLADLGPVAGILRRLTCDPYDLSGIIMHRGRVSGASALDGMSQLTALSLYLEDVVTEDLGYEEPWGLLAKLTSLQALRLTVGASGDPSPLSALTGLSSLRLDSLKLQAGDQTPFSFSSLQPLSTLQQLEVLHLEATACAATSLHGLAGLSNLKKLAVMYDYRLSSLEGIGHGVTELAIMYAPLKSLAGMEGCTSVKKLILSDCGVSSLQPLWGLSGIEDMCVSKCRLTSLAGLNSMSLQSLTLLSCQSLTILPGFELFPALKSLDLENCGVTSLQSLSQLGEGLQKLIVFGCGSVQEEVLELPHIQPTASVSVSNSNVKEVILAGGVRRAVERA